MAGAERAPGWLRRRVLDPAVYGAMRAAMVLPQAAPLGRAMEAAGGAGRIFARLPANRKRLRRAEGHLEVAFPGSDGAWRRETVIASYRHLFMLGVEVAQLPRHLTMSGLLRRVEFDRMDEALRVLVRDEPCVLITGHCGNWEVLGYAMGQLGFPMHALYRPLDLEPLDRWVRSTRLRGGIHLLDKFGAVRQIPALMARGEPVAFVADQNAGDRGLFVPYFGRLASSYKSIGIVAIQHRATLVCGGARRIWTGGKPRYRLEIHDIIRPEDWEAQPDPMFYLTARYRYAVQRMVETAPEQYLWMHRIWKSRPRHERLGKPFPPALREKLASLPWMSEEDVDRLVDRSDRDARFLAENGLDRLP